MKDDVSELKTQVILECDPNRRHGDSWLVDDEFIREAKEQHYRCTHLVPKLHGHSGSCESAALEREGRLLKILERRS